MRRREGRNEADPGGAVKSGQREVDREEEERRKERKEKKERKGRIREIGSEVEREIKSKGERGR